MSSPAFIVAFDQAHKERGKISSSLSKLTTEILNKNGFFCEEYSEFPITSKNLRPFDIVVFSCPDNSRISRQEIDALKRWVREEGGGLLLLSHAGGDKGRRSNLSELGEQFGMIFENDQVLDKVNNHGVENLPAISYFPFPHPITENVTDVCYRAGCSLSLSSATITPVISSGPNAEPVEAPLLLAGELGEGRVVAIGSYEMFRDRISGGIKHGSHKQLALNIFNWLKTTKREQIKGMNSAPRSTADLSMKNTSSIQQILPGSTPPAPGFPTVGKTYESTVKIVANVDVFRAFEDALTEMFSFKERMLTEFDLLQKNLANLMRAVIATEDDLIRVDAQGIPEGKPSVVERFTEYHNHIETVKPPQTPVTPEEPSSAPPQPTIEPPMEKKTEAPVIKPPTKEELEAELESLQNKLKSIKNLKGFVEKKFAGGKLTEPKYEKQMAKLEKDRKKTNKRIKECKKILQKL
jgi:hypothetical protein